ncbi:CLUMA_CG009495, isoform A, partial [Clunio marinus]
SALVIVSILLELKAEASHNSSNDLQINNQKSLRSTYESLSQQLLQIRHLLKSLLTEWNFGESEITERTFGRIRLFRKIILPAAFIGGLLTAVIFKIKILGVLNLLLVGKVLLLQLGFMVAKIVYALKDFLPSKHDSPQVYPVYHQPPPPQQIFIPVPSNGNSDFHKHQVHNLGGHDDHSDFFKRSSEYDYRFGNNQDYKWLQQSNYYDQQPSFNQPYRFYMPPKDFPSPVNLYQPQHQMSIGQSQRGSVSGIPLQIPHKTEFHQINQLQQPQGYDGVVNGLSNQPNFNVQPTTLILPQSIDSMNPEEVKKLLSDAIARASSTKTASY